MDLCGQCADNSSVSKGSKDGKAWEASAHNGLSPIQFAFLRTYLEKNF